MRNGHISYLLAFAALAAACESAPTDPAALDATPSTQNAGVVGSAVGGGKAQLPAGFSLLSFSFNALQRADGGATGRFSQRYESSGETVEFTGTVTCVSFDPVNNRAWIGGVVTSNTSTNPAVQTPIHEVGDDVWFRVVDNGEGNAPDDRTTVLGFEGAAGVITSAEYCERQLWAAGDANTWAVVRGNIQVEP